MSVIRVGRKGLKKFAFGEDGEPFEVDVVVVFQEWIEKDEEHRDDDGKIKSMHEYHQAAVDFAQQLSGSTDLTRAEALEFIARLKDAYKELADFFQPKKREKPELQSTSELTFLTEESLEPSTN